MKKLVVPALVACSLLVFSCKKDQPAHDLFIGATINNTNWLAQPSTSYFANRDSMQVLGVTNYKNLSFKIKFTGVGNYTLANDEATFTTQLSPSGPVVFYKLDNTQTNTVHVTSFNITTNIAEGSFEMHFKTPTGDSLSLTNGSFWIQTPAVPGQ